MANIKIKKSIFFYLDVGFRIIVSALPIVVITFVISHSVMRYSNIFVVIVDSSITLSSSRQ